MRSIVVLLVTALSLSACSTTGAGPLVIVPTSAESLERAEYSETQIETYKQALKHEAGQMNLMDGMVLDFDQPDENWLPFVVRAKAFCDTARTQSWQVAETQYLEQVILEATNALPTELDDVEDLNAGLREAVAPLANAQFRAMGAPGSLCPELAPEAFATDADYKLVPSPNSEPLLKGQYFGEGCAGAGQALIALLSLIEDIRNSRENFDKINERLRDLRGALVYAEMTEPNPVLAEKISSSREPLLQLQLAFQKLDAEDFSAAVSSVALEATSIMGACRP
jgi:hypothetical protein